MAPLKSSELLVIVLAERRSSEILAEFRLLDFLLKANGRGIVGEWWKIGDSIEAPFSVQSNRFGLLHSGLKPDRVVVEFPSEAFKFIQYHGGDSEAAFIFGDEHSFNFDAGFVHRNECSAANGFSIAAGHEKNTSGNRNEHRIEDSNICGRGIVALFHLLDECGKQSRHFWGTGVF